MRGRRRIVGAVAAAAILLAAGCSDDATSDATTGAGATEATGTSTTAPPYVPGDATTEGYVDALTHGLSEGSTDAGQVVVSREQAACLAPRWVEAIGTATLQAKQVPPDLVADPAYRFGELGLDREQAEAMLDAFGPCGADPYGLFAVALTPDQDEAVQACAVASIDHARARTALLSALTGAPTLDDDLAAVVQQLVDACQP